MSNRWQVLQKSKHVRPTIVRSEIKCFDTHRKIQTSHVVYS
jgi:hypothetical protein